MHNRRLDIARGKQHQIPRNQRKKEFDRFSSSGKKEAGLGLVGLTGTTSILAKTTKAKADATKEKIEETTTSKYVSPYPTIPEVALAGSMAVGLTLFAIGTAYGMNWVLGSLDKGQTKEQKNQP